MDEKSKKNRDVKEVYKREKASKRRVDDPQAIDRLEALKNLERAIHMKDRRKFLELLRRYGITDGSEKFRQIVEIYDRIHSSW